MSATLATPSLAADVAAIVGEQHALADPAQLASYAIEGIEPALVVTPANAEEVAAIVRVGNQAGANIVAAGGMTAQDFGAAPEPGFILLRSARLKEVEHYDAGDLTVGVGAGTTLAELDAMLAANRQMLPLDGACGEAATLGGALARNAQGPLQHGYGGVRDYCIGVRFVTGDGKRAKAGGRVVKNVAGYDLMKLLIGSFGTLGVITSASFKLVPRPLNTATFAAGFGSPADALAWRDRVLASPLAPMCLEIVSPHAHDFLRAAPEPRDPDHFDPGPQRAAPGWSVLLRAAGSPGVLDRYRRELRAVPADRIDELDSAAEAELWRHAANYSENVVSRHQNAMLVQLTVPIQSAGPALEAVERAALDYNFAPAIIGRCGVGILQAAFLPLATDPPSAMQFAAAVSALRASLAAGSSAWSSAVVARCPREAKLHFNLWGEPASDAECMVAVKRALDPGGILNRGRYVS